MVGLCPPPGGQRDIVSNLSVVCPEGLDPAGPSWTRIWSSKVVWFLVLKTNMERWYSVLPGTWSLCWPCCVSSVCPEPSGRKTDPSSCWVLLTESGSSASSRLDCTPEDRPKVRPSQSPTMHLDMLVAVLTRAWKEDTEKTPRRPSMLLEGRLATARRLLGFGSSLPCRLDR